MEEYDSSLLSRRPLLRGVGPMFTFLQSDQRLTRQAFDQLVRGIPEYSLLESKVGAEVGAKFRGMYWEEVVRGCVVDRGQRYLRNFPPTSDNPPFALEVKVMGRYLPRFKETLGLLFAQEKKLIEVRESQLDSVRKQAESGALRSKLDRPVEAEPKSAQWEEVGHGRYVKAGTSTSRDEALKFACLDGKNQGAYNDLLDTYVTKDGTLPLGKDDAIIKQIWGKIVRNAPLYRMTSISGAPYPSSVGGDWLLKNRILGSTTGSLPRGDAKWADWAMYYFGAIMNAQPFPDGNKRVARIVYALMMLSGGIKFQAPSAKVGAELAKMG